MGFEQLGKKLMRLGQDTKSGVQKMGDLIRSTPRSAMRKRHWISITAPSEKKFIRPIRRLLWREWKKSLQL